MSVANVRVMVLLEPSKTREWFRLDFPCIDRPLLSFYMYFYSILNCLFLGPGKILGT
jgi:hypothetical protein